MKLIRTFILIFFKKKHKDADQSPVYNTWWLSSGCQSLIKVQAGWWLSVAGEKHSRITTHFLANIVKYIWVSGNYDYPYGGRTCFHAYTPLYEIQEEDEEEEAVLLWQNSYRFHLYIISRIRTCLFEEFTSLNCSR